MGVVEGFIAGTIASATVYLIMDAFLAKHYEKIYKISKKSASTYFAAYVEESLKLRPFTGPFTYNFLKKIFKDK